MLATFKVWILVVAANTASANSPAYIIDNIPTAAECERIKQVLAGSAMLYSMRSMCIEVTKLR